MKVASLLAGVRSAACVLGRWVARLVEQGSPPGDAVGMFNSEEERTLRSYRSQGSNGLWTLDLERRDLEDHSEYLTEVAYDLNNFAGTKPFPISEDDPDWVPSLKRGIPQGDAPYRGRRGWF